jgi:ADP-heptose:LPS heptosyltransferase
MLIKKLKQWNRQKNSYLRQVKFYLAQLLFDRRQASPFVADAVKKILILRDDNKIGDMIVATGLIAQLQASGRQVSVVCGKDNRIIVEHSDLVEKIFPYKNKVWDIIRLGWQLRRERYDMLLDFGDYISPIYYILISLISARHTLGFNKSKFVNYDLNIDYPYVDKHITDRYRKVLQLFSLEQKEYPYIIDIPENIYQDVDRFLNGLNGGRLVVINPFTASAERDLSLTQLEGIIANIQSLDSEIRIVVIGPQARLNNLQLSHVAINPYASFLHAAACIKQADLVISPDTSCVHVACAFARPLIALYGSNLILGGLVNNKVWAPNYLGAVQIITSEPSIASISVEEINQQIEHYLC